MRRLAWIITTALACAPEPATPAQAPVIAAETPGVTPAPARSPLTAEPAAEPPTESPTEPPSEPGELGIPACDAYLQLYRTCEPRLRPEIAAGNRRNPTSEAAWLRYLHEHEKDPNLATACKSWLESLQRPCAPAAVTAP